MTEPKVAFVVWNPFQVIQFQKLAEAYSNSRFLLIGGPQTLQQFDAADLAAHRPEFEIIPKERITDIDGVYDVIFFQSPFAKIEEFRLSRLVSVQYGLAKERHNYGEWRALADMNLMYGPYSADFTSHYSPSYAVGNVKFAGWDHDESKRRRPVYDSEMGLDPSKKTILFMPTYGELGSFSDLIEPLSRMADDYNVVIKMHHNNESKGKDWRSVASDHGIRFLMGGDADQTALLSVADLVVSDFSGAIFDAVYAEIPVLLYQARANDVVGVQKFSHRSIEFRRRNEIGMVCDMPESFARCVAVAMEQGASLVEGAAAIRKELFVDGRQTDTIALAKEKVAALLAGDIPALTPAQTYVRETCQELRSALVNVRKLEAKLQRRPTLIQRIKSSFGL